MRTQFLSIALIAVLFSGSALADPTQDHLQECLKKAADMPDIAMAEANAWMHDKGGTPAQLCRATALFHRGDFVQSADDFTQLATVEKDSPHAAFLYQQAGLAFTRASNFPQAEASYAKALKLEKQDPDIWLSRASARAAAQHYWDAIGDLDQALAIMPDMQEALRLRGQVWFKLGMEARAEADFRRVAEVQAEDDVIKTRASTLAVRKK